MSSSSLRVRLSSEAPLRPTLEQIIHGHTAFCAMEMISPGYLVDSPLLNLLPRFFMAREILLGDLVRVTCNAWALGKHS